MKAGAVDFLTNPFAGKDLLDAIERALAKDTRDLGTEARVAEIQQRVKRLTPRETEVFALAVTGMLKADRVGTRNLREDGQGAPRAGHG